MTGTLVFRRGVLPMLHLSLLPLGWHGLTVKLHVNSAVIS